jgi:hypothetical protein
MQVTIELWQGRGKYANIIAADMRRNIAALNRAAHTATGADRILLEDTKSILLNIQKQLHK